MTGITSVCHARSRMDSDPSKSTWIKCCLRGLTENSTPRSKDLPPTFLMWRQADINGFEHEGSVKTFWPDIQIKEYPSGLAKGEVLAI